MVYEFMSLNPVVEFLDSNEILRPLFIALYKETCLLLFSRYRYFPDPRTIIVFTAIQALKFLVVYKPQFSCKTMKDIHD